jgi:hypothetical protein
MQHLQYQQTIGILLKKNHETLLPADTAAIRRLLSL